MRTGQRTRPRVRASVGRCSGLAILIIADIIQTVIFDPTLGSAATPGVIVLVRIVLSFSLEIELDSRLAWRKGADTPPSASPADAT